MASPSQNQPECRICHLIDPLGYEIVDGLCRPCEEDETSTDIEEI